MSVARHHADWLKLIEASGPFISLEVAQRVFPQGLEPRDPAQAKALRDAYEIWQDNPSAPGQHRAWIMHVLTEILRYPKEQLAEGQSLPAGLEARIPEHSESLRPDFALVGPTGAPTAGKAQLLVVTYPGTQNLERPVSGKLWKATPATRMMELLHACDVPLGLLTNGDCWMLVHAPRGEVTGYAPWFSWLWLDEPIALRAFHSLLSARRFFGVAQEDTLLGMFQESAKNQQEVTDQLGYQVREAVEVLVQSIDALDRDSGGTLLENVPPQRLYNAALTVMMRLVFLFSAEERGLLHLGKPLYDENYAVSTLLEQLQEVADRYGEEVLERRSDAWARLLATFRAVHGGIQHQDLLLPGYGGSLFDPDRYPFLEGRPPGTDWRNTPADPLGVNNRVALHLLDALQRLQVKVAGGGPAESVRVRFNTLDVEQIGHVYEGLLDHTALRAEEPVLGISGTRKKEPEIPLSTLEALLEKGETGLVDFLKKETGRSPAALKKALAQESLEDWHKLQVACRHDDALLARLRPFAGLIREDSFGRPMVILPGSVYVTAGTDRRDSGTQYTPPSFTEPVVRHALEPLVYAGPAEGVPREEWKLRPARELLDLKICDMAMGSGAFLVQTVRYLAERLMEAWDVAEAEALAAKETGDGAGSTALDTAMRNVLARPSSKKFLETLAGVDDAEAAEAEGEAPPVIPRITPEGSPATGAPSEQLVPADPEERKVYAQRIVTDRCIYGVDINPMAVEMAKLSLWLTTMDKARAFTFLDHALKCGDALLGLYDVRQVHKFHLDPEAPVQGGMWGDHLQGIFHHALAKRRELESFTIRDITDTEHKARLLAEADAAMGAVKTLCDLLIAAAVSTADGNAQKRGAMMANGFETHRHRIFDNLSAANSQEEIGSAVEAVQSLADEGRALLNGGNPNLNNPRKPFHWVLEFPEVFVPNRPNPQSPTSSPPSSQPQPLTPNPQSPGFSAFVGNPPFIGGQKITGVLGTDYRNYCIDALAEGRRGSADLCAYFFLRAGALLRPNGAFALIATNTIAQGDTREVGLDALEKTGAIFRANPSTKWPGAANLEVAQVWWRKGVWQGDIRLEDKAVKGITPYLSIPGKAMGKPYRLKANAGKSFIGSYVLGMGFVMPPEEAAALIEKDPRNKDVLFPYLNGEDLNSRPDQSPSRWVINFHDWPLDRSASGCWVDTQRAADEGDKDAARQITEWLRAGRVPADYPDQVAADYPDCLAIVEETVKPERDKNNRKVYRDRWWHYAEKRPELYATISGLERVLTIPRVSKYLNVAFSAVGIVPSEATVVIADSCDAMFAVCQCSLHQVWTQKLQSSLETRGRYTPSDCFETYPLPPCLYLPISERKTAIKEVGTRYDSFRQKAMLTHYVGLTDLYNRFHDAQDHSDDIVEFRHLHGEMDQSVASEYGWSDLDLDHGFHETKQGIRYTISEAARREVLDRLLALNHERYEEEVKAGLHDKGTKKAKKASPAKKRGRKAQATDQGELF